MLLEVQMGEFYCKVSPHANLVKIGQKRACDVQTYMGHCKHLDRNSNTV